MPPSQKPLFLPAHEMEATFFKTLLQYGMPPPKAQTCASIFTESSLDGVYTHGVNRFPRFVEYIIKGLVNVNVDPVCAHQFNGIEQWNGQSGIGPVNALIATNRSTELAAQFGIGCVALSHTNHWMRGGTYGWEAAKKGFIFIGWTNTIANMPAWGAVDSKLGNNPIVFAIPYKQEAIVLDMAMSQYSFGTLELQKIKQNSLAVPGGYNKQGILSTDPEEIIQSGRVLPVGYWKGAGMSLLLDILATVLSGGLSAKDISAQPAECNLSQVFISIDISKLSNFRSIEFAVQGILEDYLRSVPISSKDNITYPGQRVLQTRRQNMERGIPVEREVWDHVLALLR